MREFDDFNAEVTCEEYYEAENYGFETHQESEDWEEF